MTAQKGEENNKAWGGINARGSFSVAIWWGIYNQVVVVRSPSARVQATRQRAVDCGVRHAALVSYLLSPAIASHVSAVFFCQFMIYYMW